jgi:hypothetical protein
MAEDEKQTEEEKFEVFNEQLDAAKTEIFETYRKVQASKVAEYKKCLSSDIKAVRDRWINYRLKEITLGGETFEVVYKHPIGTKDATKFGKNSNITPPKKKRKKRGKNGKRR